MPIYDPGRVEYTIVQGRVAIVTEDGTTLPAYWAHPDMGGRFPSVALLHDWWGITALERHLAHLFAGLGYYTIMPDLFQGQTARTPTEALKLVTALGEKGYSYADTALGALEQHGRTNSSVAAVGLGMGGSLALEAAITRPDLEAAVACYGFPGRFLGRFKEARTPILAIFGSQEPHVTPKEIARLRSEFEQSSAGHQLVILDGVGREFFDDDAGDRALRAGKQALEHILSFVERYVGRPRKNPAARP
jgi:carboxymethylenebutenolidase